MYLNCNICKHVIVDKFAAQVSLATALSERRSRYTLLPLLLSTCKFWKFWTSQTSLGGHLPRLLIMPFQSQFDFLYLGWMPWQGRVAETISEKILYYILTSFTFLLPDVACHILISVLDITLQCIFFFARALSSMGGGFAILKTHSWSQLNFFSPDSKQHNTTVLYFWGDFIAAAFLVTHVLR